jgi:2-hydroxy-3-keto-5-methylthiopentenyl-1-phosphate phosphatase
VVRFFDKVGYGTPGELVDGVWSDSITERDYYGEVLEATRSLEGSEKVNDDIRLQNRISIMADAFAFENFSDIRYVLWQGSPWMVNSVEVRRPRLVLSLGGVYSGPRPTP